MIFINLPADKLCLKLALFSIIAVFSSCEKKGAATATPEKSTTEDTIVLEQKEPEEPPLIVTYHLDSLSNKAAVDSFQTKYNDEQKKIIFALNRIDHRRLHQGKPLIIPDTLVKDFNDYSPFPEVLSILDSIPKTVLISQRVQAFALYEKGQLIKWGPVSAGKQSTPTPNGLHYGNYKARSKTSTVDDAWILPYYFNFMNFDGVGVHQYELPGYPASHACVRLRMDDAKYIYNWASQWDLNKKDAIEKNGTPFMVYGEYDYENPYPWRNLMNDNTFIDFSEKDLEILKSYIATYNKDKRNFEKKEESIDLAANNLLAKS